MKHLIKAATVGAAVIAPAFVFATGPNFFDILGILGTAVNTLLPFVIALAVLIILWGLFNYIAGAGDEEKRAQAKQYIIWGIIGLFVMVSIWGLVNVLGRTFNLTNTAQSPPQPVGGTRFNCPDGTPAPDPDPETGAVECP